MTLITTTLEMLISIIIFSLFIGMRLKIDKNFNKRINDHKYPYSYCVFVSAFVVTNILEVISVIYMFLYNN